MKAIYSIPILSLLLLTACSKTVSEVDMEPEEVVFRVADYATVTKADPVSLDGNTAFGVFAYHHYPAWSALSDLSVFMGNVSVSHRTSPDAWAPALIYYWPKTGMLSFAGYAPYMASGVSYSKTDGICFTDYVQTPTPGSGNQVSLLYSDEAASKDLTYDNGHGHQYGHDGVPMLFHHALSKLNFKIRYSEDGLNDAQKAFFQGTKIKSLKLYNINYKGSFKSTGASWTLAQGADALVVSSADPAVLLSLTTSAVTEAEDVLVASDYFVLPQPIIGDANLEIEYYILPDETNPIRAQLSLRTDQVTSWIIGTDYTYTLLIKPTLDKPILFAPKYKNWDKIDVTPVLPVEPQ